MKTEVDDIKEIKENIRNLSLEFSLLSSVIVELKNNTESMVNLLNLLRDDINSQDGKIFIFEKIFKEINDLKVEIHTKKKYIQNFAEVFQEAVNKI